jgi:hypothetical protein
MNIIKSPQDNIEAYLYNEINIELFDENMFHEPERLIFFNLLFKEFEFFCENNNNYLSIINYFESYNTYYISDELNEDELEKEREKFADLQLLYDYLDRLIENKYPKNTRTGVLLKSCEYIESINNRVSDLFMTGIEPINNFYRLQESIESLSNEEKLIELVKYKHLYLNFPFGFQKSTGNSFEVSCELEIQKINELIKYETTQPQQTDQKQTKEINSLKWQGTPLQFAELTKALKQSNLISPEISQKDFFKIMKQIFNVDEFDEGDKLKEIRKRTNTTTPLLNILETSLNNWIKNKD